MKRPNETYIGDGVYASYDGFQIWLRTEREGGDHEIALEPEVFASLTKYVGQTWKMAAFQ